MGISGVGATTLSSFPQINREVHSVGMQATKERSDQAASYSKVIPLSALVSGRQKKLLRKQQLFIKFPISVQTRR